MTRIRTMRRRMKTMTRTRVIRKITTMMRMMKRMRLAG